MKKLLVLLATMALGAAACGGSSGDTEAGEAEGVIEVVMTDLAFTPDTVSVKAGEPVEFLFRNRGAVAHEAVIGTMHIQEEHEAEMAEGMHMEEEEGHHGDVPVIDLEPGETGTLTHTFEEPGTFVIGCHYPGHWDAGMQATVTVTS